MVGVRCLSNIICTTRARVEQSSYSTDSASLRKVEEEENKVQEIYIINNFDVDLQRIVSLMFSQSRPIRFKHLTSTV